MVRVGIMQWVDGKYLTSFPPEAELVRYDPKSDDPFEAEFLIAPGSNQDAERAFRRCSGLKVVQAMSAGVEGLLPALPPGVTLANAQGVHNIATSEWVVAVILASLKYLPFYLEQQARGTWTADRSVTENYEALHHEASDYPTLVLTEELYERTVLIVGYGAIGRAIEDRLRGFGVHILRIARSAREGVSPVSDLLTLLPRADVVVLITPLTPETTHLINAAALEQMKPGALLVNAARGAVVDTDALVAALRAGKLRAALDVTDPEPLPEGHPLWSAPNALITPHVAGSTPRTMPAVFAFIGTQITRYVRGVPLANLIRGAY